MVWFFEHPYPDGYKSYSRSKPLTIDEFGLEKKWWGGAERRGRKPSEYAWKISAAEIVEKGYNLDAVGRHPHQNEVNHGDPEELMRNYQRIGDELQSTQTVLKTELIDALNTAGGDIQARRFLSQHFGEFYAIKENVAELRNTIIELAVLGKLVPQNPGDSPASELIDRIDAERTHLIRAGKIRGPKSPATSTEMVDVPLLPHGWIWTPLQSLQPSPDRMDSKVGDYGPANFQLAHLACNLGKNNATETEFAEWLDILKSATEAAEPNGEEGG